jgi:hypothetical protein
MTTRCYASVASRHSSQLLLDARLVDRQGISKRDASSAALTAVTPPGVDLNI